MKENEERKNSFIEMMKNAKLSNKKKDEKLMKKKTLKRKISTMKKECDVTPKQKSELERMFEDMKQKKEKKMKDENPKNDEKLKNDDEITILPRKNGEKGQFSAKNRTFFEKFKLENQFGGDCSLTTSPREGRKFDGTSKGEIQRIRANFSPKLRLGARKMKNSVPVIIDSPGKRKLEAMENQNENGRVHDLIEIFEVGTQTKRVKLESTSSCKLNQPHFDLKFGTGNTVEK